MAQPSFSLICELVARTAPRLSAVFPWSGRASADCVGNDAVLRMRETEPSLNGKRFPSWRREFWEVMGRGSRSKPAVETFAPSAG